MGKLASSIKNILLGFIAVLLMHLSYRLYVLTENLNLLCIGVNQNNILINSLYEAIKLIAKKYKILLP